jgi:Cd2+/Zn2+-exporting ATPase
MVTPAAAPLTFKVHGLDCAEEVAILKREIGPLAGGEDRLQFDVLNARMFVAAEVDAAAVIERVRQTGMRAELVVDGAAPRSAGPGGNRVRNALTAVSGLLTLAGFLLHAWLDGGFAEAIGSEGMGHAHNVPWPVRAVYAVGIICGVWYVLPKAGFALRRLRPDMNLLMVIALTGALLIGEWFEAATVSFLFALSLALESWSVGRARRAVEKLLDLSPPGVRVLHQDHEHVMKPEDVAVGTRFLVKPGERIALDGEVVAGTSDVNEAPITGESIPAEKSPGRIVYAGTVNGSGALEVRSTKVAGDTVLAHIAKLVGQAHARRAPSEQWVDRFARVYTPLVMVLALLVLLVPTLFLGSPWHEASYRSLVLLVIACPCALVISTPVSIVASLASAARHGVLIKGGLFVELPARIQAIALDKTGTLTEGKPAVMEVIPLHAQDPEELLALAAALESRSHHPIARAIVAHAAERGIAKAPVSDFVELQGRGATALWRGVNYWIGSHRYLHERRHLESAELCARIEELSGAGRTVVCIGHDEAVVGLILLADRVRPESARALQALRGAGIAHVAMLTGDNQPTARAIAEQTGVDEVYAELLPDEKVAAVEKLVARYGHVMMVGDGINDAPAMARSTLGIAMGAVGSDAAVEAADVALMSDDLSKLPWLIGLSRRTLRIIRQNIVLSIFIKVLFVVLTFTGGASLWAAISADMGVSLLVIFNALRLLRD